MKRLVLVLLAVAGITSFAQDCQPVIAQLRDGSAGTRIDALKRLNEAGHVTAVDPVAPLLTHPAGAVQCAATDPELPSFPPGPTRQPEPTNHRRPQPAKAGRGGPDTR